jgi:predicted O-linked N-acetylglucosamine transferase (SPINDLY family)
MPELICADTQSYIHRVCELGRDPAQRVALRERLVKARDESALFDAPRFARDLEQLLLRMWQRHADGLPPAALPAQH